MFETNNFGESIFFIFKYRCFVQCDFVLRAKNCFLFVFLFRIKAYIIRSSRNVSLGVLLVLCIYCEVIIYLKKVYFCCKFAKFRFSYLPHLDLALVVGAFSHTFPRAPPLSLVSLSVPPTRLPPLPVFCLCLCARHHLTFLAYFYTKSELITCKNTTLNSTLWKRKNRSLFKRKDSSLHLHTFETMVS